VVTGLLAALMVSRTAYAQRRSATTHESFDRHTMVSVRAMVGAAHMLRSSASNLTEWTVDLHAGVRLLDTRRRGRFLALGADVGLSLGPRGDGAEALWLGGPSGSVGGVWFMMGWSPRFVFGSLAGTTALGLRNTVSLCAFVGVVCLDLAHQYLSVGVGSQHDVRAALGLDLGMIAQLLVQFAGARPG
jgi:hypothetical protein